MNITRAKLAATAGIVCAGGMSLAMIGTGVGANFIKNATANAHISVGTLDCQLSPGDNSGHVTISNGGHTATVNLDEIDSSAPGSSTAPVTVTNAGSMPMYVNWVVSTSGSIFNSGAVTPHPVTNGDQVAAGHSETYNLGFDWQALNNADLGTKGTATYTADCTDTRSDLALWQQNGGTSAWSPDGKSIVLGIPANPADGAAGGIQVENQSTSLPGTEPVFTTDNYAAGSPRWYIQFSNGDYVFGYPTNSGLNPAWEEHGPGVLHPSGEVSWSTVTTDFASTNVSQINILMDGDQTNTTDTISYIQYDGQVLLGS